MRHDQPTPARDANGSLHLADDDVERLRKALAKAGYVVDNVQELLGERAADALNRNQTVPSQLALSGDSALEVLTRLFRLQLPVPLHQAQDALPIAPLVDDGFLAVEHDDHVRATIDVRPYADDTGDWWVVADLTPGLDGRPAAVPADHVLGLNAASSTLAQLTVRKPAAKALDLGTGCGVQALHLSRHCDTVVATDVNRRALAMASLTARLNGIHIDLRHGDLYTPVSGETFDLIVSNPPFVVSSGGRYVYRDSGLAGDELTKRVIVDGAAHLADGGVLQSLANWMHVRGQDWRERVGAWIETTGCDASILQREVQDPAEYVELWLRDSGEFGTPGYQDRYREWLAWFDENDVEGVGFGWVTLRASRTTTPTVRIEDWPHAVSQPIGSAVASWFDRAAAGRVDDDTLLGSYLTFADDVVLEQVGQPGAADPQHLVLRQHHGLMRAAQVSTAEAGFVGACDGSLPVAAIIDAVATVIDTDAVQLRRDLIPRVRQLIQDGFLLPHAT